MFRTLGCSPRRSTLKGKDFGWPVQWGSGSDRPGWFFVRVIYFKLVQFNTQSLELYEIWNLNI
jgi:hypothetical protein